MFAFVNNGGSTAKRRKMELKPKFELSFEGVERRGSLDEIDAALLRGISEGNSLTAAAKSVGVSYRNAWDRINAMERGLGGRIVEMKVGGREGGGAKLTEQGVELLREFRRVRKYLHDALEDREFWEHISYELSARNRFKAKILEVQKGTVTSQVRMRTLSANTITSIISNQAVEELGMKVGDEVEAVVKATDVIIAKRAA
ncbi:MAG: TOBE domain-containing protein [Nitrososphaerota archaeon]|nr:TOBE domain-containing protein [Nitrososphaerota archaeon]